MTAEHKSIPPLPLASSDAHTLCCLPTHTCPTSAPRHPLYRRHLNTRPKNTALALNLRVYACLPPSFDKIGMEFVSKMIEGAIITSRMGCTILTSSPARETPHGRVKLTSSPARPLTPLINSALLLAGPYSRPCQRQILTSSPPTSSPAHRRR